MINREKELLSIKEVSELIGESMSLIRFWETKFSVLCPIKTNEGKRLYNQKNIAMIQTIHRLVKEEGYTLAGANLQLKKMRKEHNLCFELKRLKKFLERLIA